MSRRRRSSGGRVKHLHHPGRRTFFPRRFLWKTMILKKDLCSSKLSEYLSVFTRKKKKRYSGKSMMRQTARRAYIRRYSREFR